jgi:hypothetical protein
MLRPAACFEGRLQDVHALNFRAIWRNAGQASIVARAHGHALPPGRDWL